MRDIGKRLAKYRLSRYAIPRDPWRRRLRWILLGAAIWMLWAGVISDHSFYRLWRLEREAAQKAQQLEAQKAETERLTFDLEDPEAQRLRTETALRDQGMAGKNEIVYRYEANVPDSLR